MRKGEADVIAGFAATPSQVVGAAFPRQQLNMDNGITAGNSPTNKEREGQ